MNDLELDGQPLEQEREKEAEGYAWFDRTMRPFNQDEEEQEYNAKAKEQDKEQEEAGGEQEEPGEEQEAHKPRAPRIPSQPTQDQVDEHMLTHLPFRSWCPHCVRGKSKGGAHKRQQQEHKEVPTVVLDYTFMHENQEEREEKGMPILVVKDVNDGHRGTGMMFAMVVPSKGVQSYAVKALADIIGQLGHHEVVLKSDGEPAIVALKEAAKRERKERIVIESSPVKESKSNGAVENAIQQFQG